LFEQQDCGALRVELPTQVVRQHAAGFAQHPAAMRVVGGTACMVDALRVRLVRTQVLLGTRVRGFEMRPDGTVGVETERSGQVGIRVASSVVLAMPPRLLASMLRWSPALPAELSQRWADAPTWMAGHAKVLALYATPFWRAAGLSGNAVSQAGPLAEVHDASDAQGQHGALFGFVGISAAWRRRMGRQALIELSVAQLARLFGADALTPRAVYVQDWADEVETATPADALPSSAHPVPMALEMPAPWRHRVYWRAASSRRTVRVTSKAPCSPPSGLSMRCRRSLAVASRARRAGRGAAGGASLSGRALEVRRTELQCNV
jgi:monoamine oxidase